MNRILAIAGADAAERMRRFSFLLTVVATLYVGYLFTPDTHASYATIVIDRHRGLYNSAYLGAATAVLIGCFLSLFGFFLVRGSVERDVELDVSGMVTASPVHRMTFLFGKYLSNLTLLGTVAGITYVAAIIMQLLRGEDRHIDLLAFTLPFLAVSIPGMAVIAAISIVFDIVRPLRGVFGGFVFVAAIWSPCLLIFPMQGIEKVDHMVWSDSQANAGVVFTLRDAAHTEYPAIRKTEIQIGGGEIPKGGLAIYTFPGIPWTPAFLEQRFLWLLASLGLVGLISPFFDRFARDAGVARRAPLFIDLARIIPNLPGLRVFRAEFALLANGASIWWTIGAIGIAVACGVSPIGNVTDYLLPLALIWPLERISALGSREARWNTGDILATTRGYAQTQLVQVAAGTLLGALICAGYLARLLVTGHPASALACVLVIAATAAIALVLGTIGGSSRPFEALYLFVWYIGPINHGPVLDFVGPMLTNPLLLASIATMLIIAASIGTAVSRQARRVSA